MATSEQVTLDASHPPTQFAIESFQSVLPQIKSAIIKSRKDWDQHEPRMWERASGLSDQEFVGGINPGHDLVLVRSGPTSYGRIIIGKVKVGVNDGGEGFVHVRIHDPPNRGNEDVVFHSIFTDEGNPDSEGRPTTFKAIQDRDTPLEFFHE